MPVQTANNRKSQADTILLAVDAEEYRRSLKRFKQAVWPIVEPAKYVDGWCQDALDAHLEAVARGDIRKIVINIPPGHTKSTELVIWRAWLWTQEPTAQVLAASFALSLSIRDNLKVRRILESPWFVERYGKEIQVRDAAVDLSRDENQKMHFANTRGGFQRVVSIDAGTTGYHADYLIADDLHNVIEAYSDTERDNAVRWFREVWTNRVNDHETSRMVVVGQRVHEEDVSGYILKERPDWEHLNLPAEYEPTRKCFTSIGWSDPRTQEGGLLWPERFSAATLGGLKRDLGSTGYAAQYQQSPVPRTGGTFKEDWKRYFEIEGDYYILHTKHGHRKPVAIRACRNEAVCDLATSEREQADFFVIEVWAITPENECLLLHQVRGHFNNPDQQKRAIEVYERYAPAKFWVEKVAYQLAYIQQLRHYEIREEVEPNVYRVVKIVSIPVLAWTPFRDKEVRASVAAVKMEAGDMYWLRGAAYLQELEPEIFTFPKSKKKDQVDCHSMIADILSSPREPLQDGTEVYVAPTPVISVPVQPAINPFDWLEQHGGWQ